MQQQSLWMLSLTFVYVYVMRKMFEEKSPKIEEKKQSVNCRNSCVLYLQSGETDVI